MIISRLDFSWDISPNKQYSLSSTTEKYLDQLDSEGKTVDFYVLTTEESLKNDMDSLTLYRALEEYDAHKSINLIWVDPDTDNDTMEKINQPCIPSKVVETIEDAVDFAKTIGYPVIVRPAFTLGGTGGGIADNEEMLRDITKNGLRLSPITQVLIEKCISGWKEIEFEVIRDRKGNVITVCSMENFDPVGVHTGDSIVIAPTVTLTDREYQMLRTAAINIISELKVEGGCNCQFALHPTSMEYAVIEVNPRVSRSSALALSLIHI